MTQDHDRELDNLDGHIRRQVVHCRKDHRYQPDTIRMHPEDRHLLMVGDSYWFLYADTDDGPERFMGMELITDESCIDGPVVECKAYWEHGRTEPRGYVASQ